MRNVKITTYHGEKKERIECKVAISGLIDDVKIDENHEILIRVRKTVCDVCSKRYGGYHEAVIQIRADKRKLSKDEIVGIQSTVESLVESMQDKGNRALFITDRKEEHDGLDFYISDKGSALTITKKLKGKFAGSIKQSSKNVGMKDSRQVYRMTYLLRLPPFKKGDFISHGESFFRISSISGKKIRVLEISSWMEKVFDVNDLEKASIIGGEELIGDMILVNQTEDEVQVMDPKIYRTFDVRKPKNITFESNMVKIVRLDDEPYLLPEENPDTENNTKDK
jgi:nonsense-mediated mRNA decay protein 3